MRSPFFKLTARIDFTYQNIELIDYSYCLNIIILSSCMQNAATIHSGS